MESDLKQTRTGASVCILDDVSSWKAEKKMVRFR